VETNAASPSLAPDADIKMTVIAAFELWELLDKRCTSVRRLIIIRESIYDKVKDAVVAATSTTGNH
jgi:aldehyde dehydrogenase (NAD+)